MTSALAPKLVRGLVLVDPRPSRRPAALPGPRGGGDLPGLQRPDRRRALHQGREQPPLGPPARPGHRGPVLRRREPRRPGRARRRRQPGRLPAQHRARPGAVSRAARSLLGVLGDGDRYSLQHPGHPQWLLLIHGEPPRLVSIQAARQVAERNPQWTTRVPGRRRPHPAAGGTRRRRRRHPPLEGCCNRLGEAARRGQSNYRKARFHTCWGRTPRPICRSVSGDRVSTHVGTQILSSWQQQGRSDARLALELHGTARPRSSPPYPEALPRAPGGAAPSASSSR